MLGGRSVYTRHLFDLLFYVWLHNTKGKVELFVASLQEMDCFNAVIIITAV